MWVSALPTDSQVRNYFSYVKLLSSITVNYLEDVYRETKIAKAFLINWPLQPKLEKGSNSIMLYQINPPSTEPHFNVVFQDNLIQCYSGKENFFFSMVVFLFIMRTQFTEMMKNLHLDDFVNSIIKI